MAVSRATDAFFQERVGPLSQTIRQVFEALTADVDPADVLGLGVFSDVVGASLVVAVNTRQGYEANLLQYAGPDDDAIDWELYLRWYPGEWQRNDTDYPTPASADIDRIWGELRDLESSAPKGDRRYWPSIQFETAALAMGYLQEDGWFARFPNSIRTVAIMDEGFTVPEDFYRWGRWVNDESALSELARYIAHEASGDR